MTVQRQTCHFHADEDVLGVRTDDGAYSFTCDRTGGHPSNGPYSWLHDREVSPKGELTGLAEELGLATELPAALAKLGNGWFEYGLVERAYARTRAGDFRTMVARWGHTAVAKKQYTASAYIAGVLGRLAANGHTFYRPGPGTGRWNYNSSISYWSIDPAANWDARTTWVESVGDASKEAQEADLECRAYVLGDGAPPEG